MKQAKGQVKKLLQVLGEVQSLIGNAKVSHYNDRDRNAFVEAQEKLEKAFNLCVEASSEYYPFDCYPDSNQK